MKYISSNLLIKAFVFLTQIMIAFFITVEELGEVKTAQAMVEVFSLFACLGLNASILATAPKISNIEERRELYSQIMVFILCSAFSVVLILTSSLYLLIFLGWSIPITMFQTIPLILMMSAITLLVSFIQCEKAFSELAKGQLFAKMISLPLVVLASFIFGLLGYISTLYFTAIITIIFLLKSYEFKFSFAWGGLLKFKQQWVIGKGAFLSNILGTGGFYAGLFVTNAVVTDPKLVGTYAFALILLSGFEVISRSIQQYYIPYFSTDFSQKNLLSIENKCLRFSSLLIFPVVILVGSLKYRDNIFPYVDALVPFLILFISWIISFKYTLKAGYFIACGRTMLNFKASIVNVLLTVALSYILGNLFGLTGIAFARLVTVLVLIVVYRKLYERE